MLECSLEGKRWLRFAGLKPVISTSELLCYALTEARESHCNSTASPIHRQAYTSPGNFVSNIILIRAPSFDLIDWVFDGFPYVEKFAVKWNGLDWMGGVGGLNPNLVTAMTLLLHLKLGLEFGAKLDNNYKTSWAELGKAAQKFGKNIVWKGGKLLGYS